MINAGIFNGDQIFVNCCNTAENGDTVVALMMILQLLRHIIKRMVITVYSLRMIQWTLLLLIMLIFWVKYLVFSACIINVM